jgi:hypothetical protein
VLGVVISPPETVPPRRTLVLRTMIRLCCFLALAVAAGAASGVAWWAVVDLPTYRVHSDGGAATTERGLSEFISGDAWFVVIGLVVGVGLGLAGWRWLRRMGWSLVLVVAFAALAAELTCWLVGYRLGPGEFAPRLAVAKPGDLVPIELTLRARASLLTWPFFAVIPILLGSSLGPDAEDPRPIFPRRASS